MKHYRPLQPTTMGNPDEAITKYITNYFVHSSLTSADVCPSQMAVLGNFGKQTLDQALEYRRHQRESTRGLATQS